LKWLLGLVLLGIALVFFWKQQVDSRPENAVVRAAQQYLAALGRGDFETAYAMLSRDSQASCSLEDFKRLRAKTPWVWGNVAVARMEPDAVLVSYDLQLTGEPAEKDYLFFALEDGRWVRPYNWNLMQRIENDFDRNAPDQALLEAEVAVKINPRDPMARGYVCEAVYYLKNPSETDKQCQVALQLSQIYPSKLSPRSLYHLRAIMGDTLKNSLHKFPAAVEQYDAMLAFPDLAPEDRCDLWLARADAYAAMKRPDKAREDLASAAAVCAKPNDLSYIRLQQTRLQGR
jgi:hypothetical protein